MWVLAVASYSFQIAGAIILLIWCFTKYSKERVVEVSLLNHNTLRLSRDHKKIIVRKEEAQKMYIEKYQGICAVLYIIIGYICAIFLQDYDTPRWIVFTIVAFASTTLSLGVSKIIEKTVYRKCNNNLSIDASRIKIPDGTVAVCNDNNVE